MLRDTGLEQIEKELQKLKAEQNRILDQIRELEQQKEEAEKRAKYEIELR